MRGWGDLLEMEPYFIYVGSYADQAHAGIHWLRFDPESGALSPAGSISGISNPSFLAFDQSRRVLYAVSECEEGAVVSYQVNAGGGLTEVSRQSTAGASPCHLALDRTGTWLAVTNYGGGSVSLFQVRDGGVLDPCADCVQHTGSGPLSNRQEAAHPHSTTTNPTNGQFIVADLGADQIYGYGVDEVGERLVESARTTIDPGTGPRHMAFHPTGSFLYVVGELNSTITTFVFAVETGRFERRQTVSTLPLDLITHNTTAHIQVDEAGRFLYCSNRGHDTIATFSVGAEGTLTQVAWTSCGGQTPRHFARVQGTPYLIVALQDSDLIVTMTIGDDGVPHLTGQSVRVESPVCILV